MNANGKFQSAAVILLSGGLDSATVLAIARRDAVACYALSFRYGQRHAVEIDAARRVANTLGVIEHRIVDIDLGAFGGSALTDESIAIPKANSAAAAEAEIPVTYVPARNTIFLSFALGWAEVLGARDIYAGMNAVDYSGYPDCRPEYIAAFQRMAALATKAGVEGNPVRIHTPLIDLTKAAIIRLGHDLGVDYGITHSCYDPAADGAACGACDSCHLRREGFAQAGVSDPTRYRKA